MEGYCLADLLEDPIEIELPRDRPLRFDDTYCWVCGAAIVDVHRKIICKHCGFTRDCSDP